MSARKITSRALAAQQQMCVDELTMMISRLERLADGARREMLWFPRDDFAYCEGQINVMFNIATQQLRDILMAFDDCAEKSVQVVLP